ncbi:hypothetical protein LAV72_18670 [Lysinibacillus xylanilyticus]|uniref:hypothetical protein n=1 Tax=Lysinibacillus xylanilyticus TaxID=582475 RepID=UPI002B25384D|nr:hypothetical protein [Lysinibacillus xylanilyticus]MEB2301631.1 hypothetical protein [Lysinibacillus xylanilyticus]
MEIALIHSSQQSLKEQFVNTGLFSIKEYPNLKLLSDIKESCLILDEDVVSKFELGEKGNDLKGYQYVFYLIASPNEDIEYFCEANHIMPIVKTNVEAIYQKIKVTLFPRHEKTNRLFVFAGADRKAGTSTVVHAVAHALKSYSTRKTLVVSLTSHPNDTLVHLSQSSIDQLHTRIATKVITFSEVLQIAETLEGGYQFIAGSRNILQSKSYGLNELAHFINVLREQDEYNVLIDIDCDVYNPMTLAALQQVHTKFLVLRPLESYYNRFEQCVQQVFERLNITRASFKYVINQFDETLHPVHYMKSHDLMTVAKIGPSPMGDAAENQRVSLHLLDKRVGKEAEVLANLIAVQSGSRVEVVTPKRTLLGKWFSRKEETEYV